MAKRDPKRGKPQKKASDPSSKNPSSKRAKSDSAGPQKMDPALFRDKLIGQTLGKCKIEKYVGEGRTAVVYRAAYAPLKRTVAIKVLQDSMKQHPAVVRVFQQEGRAVAALDHENVLKIYDVGEDKGQHYLVLELLEGRELLSIIKEAGDEALPVDDALEFMRQAAAGLAAAHRKNLVHRDIKPQNMVVEPDGKLKIVDFGLAAEAEGAFSGGRLGTPHYMAPEQCRGEHALTASDVYALGINLFHMLTGRPPYAGSKTTQEIIDHHLRGESLEPEKFRPTLPREVGNLVRQMTQMDPAARPTAAKVRDTIAEKLSPGRLSNRRRSTGKAVRRARRTSAGTNPMLFVGGGVALLAIVIVAMMNSGSDDPTDSDGGTISNSDRRGGHSTTGTGSNSNKSDPSRGTDSTTTSDRKPEVDGDPKRGIAERIKVLMRDAKKAEADGEPSQALFWYQQVLQASPSGSPEYVFAKGKAKEIRDLIEKNSGGTQSSRRKHITRKMSEATGEEFDAMRAELWKRTLDFDLTAVKAELTRLKESTRDNTPERARIVAEEARVERISKLFGIIPTRASSLRDNQVVWKNYDTDAAPDLIVTGANEKGVLLLDEVTNTASVVLWKDIAGPDRIGFIEALRNRSSAEETVYLGYYAKLLGDVRADQYFGFAKMLDKGREMQERIRVLSSGD